MSEEEKKECHCHCDNKEVLVSLYKDFMTKREFHFLYEYLRDLRKELLERIDKR